MPAIQQVLIAEFYRRNYLFFLLITVLLVFVFRPPTLLVSPWFVLPMLESSTFLALVMGLLGCYYLKCWRESWLRIHLAENRFLQTLAVLPFPHLTALLAKQMISILAPGLIYALIVAGYSFVQGTWHGWLIIGIHIGLLAGMAIHLAHGIRHPREPEIRAGLQAFLEQQFRESFAFIGIQTLWYANRLGLLLTKGLVWGLMILALIGHHHSVFSDRGLQLLFLSLVSLQLMLPYWLRKSEDSWIFLLRNLPLSRGRRFGQYIQIGLLLFLPESLLWLGEIRESFYQPVWKVSNTFSLDWGYSC